MARGNAKQLDSFEVNTLVGLLLRLTPDTISDKIFNAALTSFVLSAYEAVCLRERNGRLEVFLTLRPSDSPGHANQWHCPGTFVRRGEEEKDTFARLGTKEFGGRITSWDLVDILNNTAEDRGHVISVVWLVAVESFAVPALVQRQWCPVAHLPEDIVPHHREVIRMAVRRWQNSVPPATRYR